MLYRHVIIHIKISEKEELTRVTGIKCPNACDAFTSKYSTQEWHHSSIASINNVPNYNAAHSHADKAPAAAIQKDAGAGEDEGAKEERECLEGEKTAIEGVESTRVFTSIIATKYSSQATIAIPTFAVD